MRSLSLDRFEVGISDPQDRPARYRGRYDDPYDDGDWMEWMDEEKKRRLGLIEEEESE